MIDKYRELIDTYKHIPRQKSNRTFLEISGFPHYENVISNILQFYLDPLNEHDLNDLLLKSLYRTINLDYTLTNKYLNVSVDREVTTLGGNRLDLLIQTENDVIGIENKIFHSLENDLNDYSETIEHYCFATKKPTCILLSLNEMRSEEDKTKLTSNKFQNITYSQFFEQIRESITTHSQITSPYLDHLKDLMKTIDNLNGVEMENKPLAKFLQENEPTIENLIADLNKYKNTLNQKVNQLANMVPNRTSASQWIYSGFCLVHDFSILNRYKISVDTCILISGWEIQLFGRDLISSAFLFDTICAKSGFLPEPLKNYKKTDRLIFKSMNTDVSLSEVANSLIDLISRIQKFKEKFEIAQSQQK